MTKENTIKNYGKSIRTKLLNVAKKEDVFYQTILTRYFQERLLFRMSQTKYRSNFYLKGGALMYAYERFTVVTLAGFNDHEDLTNMACRMKTLENRNNKGLLLVKKCATSLKVSR